MRLVGSQFPDQELNPGHDSESPESFCSLLSFHTSLLAALTSFSFFLIYFLFPLWKIIGSKQFFSLLFLNDSFIEYTIVGS